MDGSAREAGPRGTAAGTGREPVGGVARRGFLTGGAAVTAALSGCQAPPPRRRRSAPDTGSAPPDPGPGWRIVSRGPSEAVEGYADRVDLLPGEEFALSVSTTAPGFRVRAFRVGWYGGAQAKLIWTSDRLPGVRRPPPELIPATRTVRAGWPADTTVRTDGWPPGAYLLRLDADHGHQRFVPLVVRSPSAEGRTVLMHAPATWQAYNAWGGSSLYRGPGGGYGDRSLAVSFDRPYDGSGAEKFLVHERAAVVLAERMGLPLAYTTGCAVHADPGALRGAAAVLSLGHDEYWTPQQRRHVTLARDAGTNTAFLGANACFRRIRLEPGPSGAAGRVVVCYKTAYRDDPVFARGEGPPTHDFRQRPAAAPESSLIGIGYEGFPTDAPYRVLRDDHWLFEGTGVRSGDAFDHLVGVEYDRWSPGAPAPGPLEILAHSPLVCKGRADHADSSYYGAPGGAGVFASGTMRWVEALMAGTSDNGRNHGMDARTGAFVTRTTENLLRAFAQGPAAEHRPVPRDNTRAVYAGRGPGRGRSPG
ncbi:N,N-dimethylformamidase beta subunit family domain-containing protein [Streptomyces clavuligerus]|uniref:N,N-dimethylformamidase beta subunit-like C-terminal domain-containing protein n=1 Tax=Streptomyces clavuligerus TaxID=1901 RepID=E2Q1F3_STRCL|nr:N,N-dimethylformamidase beta subunit family domain-containing protein [Streptomyces clavuligerus]ANW16898.1 hypothetical protein BB341_00985 [Streptomyces clavuligerus]AXU11428.1 hypothetical protein D1794_01050 [Streptomyces clavuligerus]EFG10579.1 Hypothetical protein SCLAV_5512 [Streptomyces clavuligerus]MBY6301246.1 hypothetical protein [Streptomyces clavuligerus]QCS04299.1 hypothetical protein CRV15_01050 [Streptomyces clavuligerus]